MAVWIGFMDSNYIIIINDEGGILAAKVTAGNVDDRAPAPEMCRELWGSIYGNKGYIEKIIFCKSFKFFLSIFIGLSLTLIRIYCDRQLHKNSYSLIKYVDVRGGFQD